MPSDGRRHPLPSWYYELHGPTTTIDSPNATSPPAPSKVSIDFQYSLDVRRNGSPVRPLLNTESINVYMKDASVFCDARSAKRTINEMFLSIPSQCFASSFWRVQMTLDIAARIFDVVSNICNVRQDVALISFVLVVTKVMHVIVGGGRADHVEVLDTNLDFQQSFEATQLVGVDRPAPRELLENLVTEECAATKGETEECMICLEELNGYEDVKRLPCFHRFHGNCILPWFTEKDFCPLCRYTCFSGLKASDENLIISRFTGTYGGSGRSARWMLKLER